MSKSYRLKIKRIPLNEEITTFSAKFKPFQELYLDLLENKEKLKKNAPKPIFVRAPEYEPDSRGDKRHSDKGRDKGLKDIDEFTLKELEDAYTKSTAGSDSEDEEVFPDFGSLKGTSKGDSTTGGETTPRTRPVEGASAVVFEEPEDEEEKERKEKADLLFKFMVLKRQYPNVEIPDFTDHSDLPTMRRVYEQVIRRVSLDSSVETYKQYLVGGFIVLEYVTTNWLGLNFDGFTKSQEPAMNKYDRLLLELGEKNYTSLESRFSVEIRLAFLILFNAAMFYVQKNLFSGSGDNVLGMLFGQQGGAAAGAPPPKKRNKMRGPTITPEEVENMMKEDRRTEGVIESEDEQDEKMD